MQLSQLDLLKEAVARLAKPGPESPFVKGLRAQIASIEKPRAENPTEFFSAGMRSAPVTSGNPSDETEQDGIRAEALRRLKVRQLFKAPQGQTRDSSK